MARRILCPYGGWIDLPDKWLGKHARRKDEAEKKSRDAGLPDTFVDISVALALLEDWGELPDLGSNPENWNFEELDLGLLTWLLVTVYTDYGAALQVPKNSSLPSQVQ